MSSNNCCKTEQNLIGFAPAPKKETLENETFTVVFLEVVLWWKNHLWKFQPHWRVLVDILMDTTCLFQYCKNAHHLPFQREENGHYHMFTTWQLKLIVSSPFQVMTFSQATGLGPGPPGAIHQPGGSPPRLGRVFCWAADSTHPRCSWWPRRSSCSGPVFFDSSATSVAR